MEAIIGGSAVADTWPQRLYEATEGNPFFTKELVRSLVDSGGIARGRAGAWQLRSEVAISGRRAARRRSSRRSRRASSASPEELRDLLAVALGARQDVRVPGSRGARRGAKDVDDAIDRLDRRRAPRGGARSRAAGHAHVLERHRARRPLRRALAPAAQGAAPHVRGAAGGAPPGRLERVYPAARAPLLRGRRRGKDRGVRPRAGAASLDAYSAGARGARDPDGAGVPRRRRGAGRSPSKARRG